MRTPNTFVHNACVRALRPHHNFAPIAPPSRLPPHARAPCEGRRASAPTTLPAQRCRLYRSARFMQPRRQPPTPQGPVAVEASAAQMSATARRRRACVRACAWVWRTWRPPHRTRRRATRAAGAGGGVRDAKCGSRSLSAADCLLNPTTPSSVKVRYQLLPSLCSWVTTNPSCAAHTAAAQ